MVTGIFKSRPMAERISQPSRTLIPRNERTEVRFALSYEALKMKSTSAAAADFGDPLRDAPDKLLRLNHARPENERWAFAANRDFANRNGFDLAMNL